MAFTSNHQTRGYQPPKTDEEKLLAKRVRQLAQTVCFSKTIKKIGFLSDRELEIAKAAANKSGASFRAFGGYEGAERCVLAFAAEDEQLPDDVFEIVCLQIVCASHAKKLTHRDYLGAIMALGLSRETIGDILLNTYGALVYVLPVAEKCIIQDLRSVGRVNVQIEHTKEEKFEQAERQERRVSVASLRLDAVLAAILHIGRAQAAELVKGNCVSVNHIETHRIHEQVYEQDVFRIKGYGKYQLCAVGLQSKKGRTFITYCQF